MSSWVIPLYLLACLLVGGSSDAPRQDAFLQILAILLIGWTAVVYRPSTLAPGAKPLLVLTALAVALPLLQLIPLSPEIWKSLPGRESVALGFATLGYPAPSLPLSLTPWRTLNSAYALLPPIAVMLAIMALRTHRERWIAGTIVAGALASVILGALQSTSAGPQSWTYIYKYTNPGAVGFFANRNHMATLLLAALPFAGALFAAGHPHIRSRTAALAMTAAGAGGVLLILVGLVLNGSLAALALAVPVVTFSILLLPFGWQLRRIVIPVAAMAFVLSLGVLANSWAGSVVAGNPQLDSVYSRGQIWALTFKAVAQTFPVGTGLGSFTSVYVLHENPATVTVAWVNHAHNDYIELLLETGLAGLLLGVAFLSWFAVQVVRTWRSPFSTLFGKAATIAASAILAHSIVDYPLRTAAIAAVFGACLGMMAGPPRQGRSDEARHVRIA
ncbi:O-antigen ligase family protein [Sphingomonas daechungensis]|uniref:O-antigen ligase family protein n=1 Tax=Sphingomonas daechungensis TaxID=1176646 RepID=UPI003782ED3C